jgi:acyl-CoA thioester hydrolase
MTEQPFHEAIQAVYFDDFDAFRILHNARYLLFVERTIGSFWLRLGWQGTMSVDGNPDAFHVVRANHIEYHVPVDKMGDVRVRVWIAKLGVSSVVFGFSVLSHDGMVDADGVAKPIEHASGERVLVCIDPATRKKQAWSDTFRAAVTPFVRI